MSEKRIIVPAFSAANGFSTTEQRSKIMSKIKCRDTKPEIAFRKALWSKGVRYRTYSKSLPGKPDLASVSSKFAVFIDGEFWHGKDWNIQRDKIKSNKDYWIKKIERNMQRAQEVDLVLSEMNIAVFRFWSKEIKKDLEGCVEKVLEHIELQRKSKKV
jgi:DNA mismatch endonuclease (patch repair protein)